MAVPEQSSNGDALVEAIGSLSVEKSNVAQDNSSSVPSLDEEKKKSIKDSKVYLEHIILKLAKTKEKINSPDATDKEKATRRQRILNAKSTRWRIIFSNWPRDSKRQDLTPLAGGDSAVGKMAPNNIQIWGATLFDFYYVKPLPESMDFPFWSGSKLAAWMKANGEDYAKKQLKFAENEEDPYLIHPYEITGLIQDTDRWEQSTGDKRSWIRDDEQDKDVSGNEEREYWQVPQPVGLSIIFFFWPLILTPKPSSGLLHLPLIPSRIPNHGQMYRSLGFTQGLRNTSCFLACLQF